MDKWFINEAMDDMILAVEPYDASFWKIKKMPDVTSKKVIRKDINAYMKRSGNTKRIALNILAKRKP